MFKLSNSHDFSRRSVFTFAFVALFLWTQALAAEHAFEHEHQSHTECGACQLGQQLQAAAVDSGSLVNFSLGTLSPLSLSTVNHASRSTVSFQSRAPPLSLSIQHQT